MATTTTTPGRSSLLLAGSNTRKHSVRTGSRPAEPPNAPVFLEEPLFLKGLSHGAAVAGPSRVTATVLGYKQSTQHLELAALRAGLDTAGGSLLTNNNAKKRAAAEVLDLTHTTTNSPDQENGVAGPAARQTKRLKLPLTVGNGGNTNATTSATDGGKKKLKRAERVERQEKLAQESALWRAKYKKAFPSFTFYFDAIDEATKVQLGAQVKKLGSSVDQFFSKKVTHVVTSRALPSQANKENVDSPAFSTSKTGSQVDSAAGKTKKLTVRSPKSYSLLTGQKLRPNAGDLDKNPFFDPQDILSKAMDFKLKIWHLEKLNLILARINSHSPNKPEAALQRNPSLPSLLRDEQLYGTRERDPIVPRNDMHYFPPHKYYLLVEDSTGEHRPIVIQEYDKPRKHEDPSWPILYGGVEGRSGFYKYEGPPIKYQARLPDPLPKRPSLAPSAQTTDATTATKLMAGFSTTAARAVGAPNLRRAISLQNVPRAGAATTHVDAPEDSKHAAPGGIHRRDSYIAASGNSQIITSNTGTSTRSGAAMQPGTGKGAAIDKRLAVLANRTVSVSMGGSGAAAAKKDPFATATALKRNMSVGSDMKNVKRFVPARDEPKKPGYCENCRIKYDDFKTHVVSNKHRRFALNEKNWLELDTLLGAIARRTVRTESVLSPSQSSVASSSPARSVEDSGFFDHAAYDDCPPDGMDEDEGEDNDREDEPLDRDSVDDEDENDYRCEENEDEDAAL
ncbi:hypothetical protein JCM11491_003672 [Sporobolomyces phaffii]